MHTRLQIIVIASLSCLCIQSLGLTACDSGKKSKRSRDDDDDDSRRSRRNKSASVAPTASASASPAMNNRPATSKSRASDRGAGSRASDRGAGDSEASSERSQSTHRLFPASISATVQNGSSRGPYNLMDGTVSTAWCTPEGQAYGASVTLTLIPGARWTHISIRNGYQKVSNDRYGDRFVINGRPTRLSVSNSGPFFLDSGRSAQVHYADYPASGPITLTIEDWSSGRDYNLACISEIEVYGYYE